MVGPESAGARPGPACYGHGGRRPTVTDANVVAGHIAADIELPGLGHLHVDAAHRALADAGVTAEGIIAVVNANMAEALRRVSIERGVDPRGLALVAFGGAGPLHACALAELLEIPNVLVPPRAGVFSAVGILGAPTQVDLVESWPDALDHEGARRAVRELGARAADLVREHAGLTADADQPALTVALDCRYRGQSHELRVADVEDFHAAHTRHNGYARADTPIEVVALRASAAVAAPVDITALPIGARRTAVGPAAISEPDCTIWVADGWQARAGAAGALVLTRTASSPAPLGRDAHDGG